MMTRSGQHQRVWLLVLLSMLPLISWVFAAGRVQSLHSVPGRWVAMEGFSGGTMNGEGMTGLDRAGSRPPSCEHKCGGCHPCTAMQVPTITNHIGAQQYTNYEPEGWKCKCGSSIFNP